MRVKIYLKVQIQFHCPLYHIYPKYSDTASIVDLDHTAPKDCSRSVCQYFHKTFPDITLIYKNGSGVGIFRENLVTRECVNQPLKCYAKLQQTSVGVLFFGEKIKLDISCELSALIKVFCFCFLFFSEK